MTFATGAGATQILMISVDSWIYFVVQLPPFELVNWEDVDEKNFRVPLSVSETILKSFYLTNCHVPGN